MTKKIGERYDLSESATITLYYDGGATLTTTFDTVTLDAAEVDELRRAFAAQDTAESTKL